MKCAGSGGVSLPFWCAKWAACQCNCIRIILGINISWQHSLLDQGSLLLIYLWIHIIGAIFHLVYSHFISSQLICSQFICLSFYPFVVLSTLKEIAVLIFVMKDWFLLLAVIDQGLYEEMLLEPMWGRQFSDITQSYFLSRTFEDSLTFIHTGIFLKNTFSIYEHYESFLPCSLHYWIILWWLKFSRCF